MESAYPGARHSGISMTSNHLVSSVDGAVRDLEEDVTAKILDPMDEIYLSASKARAHGSSILVPVLDI